MNIDVFKVWQESVVEHMDFLSKLVDDKILLKKTIEEHLSEFFEWDEIEYDNDFRKIVLKWEYRNHPVIKTEKINELLMDFIIADDFTSNGSHGIVVELYPFGLPKEGEVVEI